MNICVVGTGYVGLVTGLCLAYLGNQVICIDNDPVRLEFLKAGENPVFEPGLDELLAHVQLSGRIRFTDNLVSAVRDSEIIFITVGTPSLPSGEPDLQYVEMAARSIGAALDDARTRIIVNKSTVPIGSGGWVEMLLNEAARSPVSVTSRNGAVVEYAAERPRFHVVSNPEFLREGSAIQDTFYPSRIVLGADSPEAMTRLSELYVPIAAQSFDAPAMAPRPEGQRSIPIVQTDMASAEMIKYAANSYLAMKISFINEVANLCEKVGADVKQVAEGIGLDARIGPHFLNAGVGWGGARFDRDIASLIAIGSEYHCEMELLTAAIRINQRQRLRLVQKLQDALKVVKGRTIGLLGLTFKPNTDELQDSPALEIARRLLKMGAKVKAYDPVAAAACQAQHPGIELHYAASIEELASGCDALALMTDWEVFQAMDLAAIRSVMRTPILLDARNMLSPAACAQAGFIYLGVGR